VFYSQHSLIIAKNEVLDLVNTFDKSASAIFTGNNTPR